MTNDLKQSIDTKTLLALVRQDGGLLLEGRMIVAAGDLLLAGEIQFETGQDGEIYLWPSSMSQVKSR